MTKKKNKKRDKHMKTHENAKQYRIYYECRRADKTRHSLAIPISAHQL